MSKEVLMHEHRAPALWRPPCACGEVLPVKKLKGRKKKKKARR